MSPESFKTWSRILRDTFTYLLGVFILLWELLTRVQPDKFWVGTGFTLLGVPAALRITQKDKSGQEGEK